MNQNGCLPKLLSVPMCHCQCHVRCPCMCFINYSLWCQIYAKIPFSVH